MVLFGMDYSGLERLYTAQQIQALDSAAIQGQGIPGITLMSRAAQASFDCLLSLWPETNSVQVLCGTGNNGGDGYLVADIAHKRGIDVTLWQLGDNVKISGDAALALQQAVGNGVEIRTFHAGCLANSGVVVDAMLGTGLSGDLREPFAGAVNEINSLDVPVLAIDIPSGLCSDSGRILGGAVKADATVTFMGLKRGMVTAAGQDHVGELQFSSLGVPPGVYEAVATADYLLDLASLLEQLPVRPALSHKGSYGRVLIIGGGEGMSGAAALAGEAALRCGAGLVAVATRVEHVSALVARTPELMVSGVRSGLELQPMVDSATVLVIG
ncbi:MAG: NAD(P)H-hydrate epimerase, partial [Alcanivorax sp.]